MRNYSALLDVAAKLTVEMIKVTDEGLLAPMLKSILVETELPIVTLEALYDKRLDALVERRCYAEALDIQNPLKSSNVITQRCFSSSAEVKLERGNYE